MPPSNLSTILPVTPLEQPLNTSHQFSDFPDEEYPYLRLTPMGIYLIETPDQTLITGSLLLQPPN